MKSSRFVRASLALLGAFVCLLSAEALAQTAPSKLAYVDMQRVIAEIDQIKVAKAKLKASYDAKQKELDAKQDALIKERTALETAARDGVMTEDKLKEKRADLEKKILAATQYLQDAQKGLMEDQQKAVQEIMGKVGVVVRGIAEEDGISFVFNGDPAILLYAPDSLDLTNEVIRKYNAKYKAEAPAAKKSDAKKDAKK